MKGSADWQKRRAQRVGVRVPGNIATSFPEIIAILGAVIFGSVASRKLGAMGLLAARNKEDDQYARRRTSSDTS